jgi:organic hydroperoxide reductase OsmC/OhrA
MKSHEHTYELSLRWEGNLGEGTATYRGYGRSYRVTLAGKPDFFGSADPAFLGDPTMYNPEDLLLLALASCHMLSYLALCAKHRILVVEYADQARGKMTTEGTGGRFQEVTLRPQVTVAPGTDLDKARALHTEANRGCFIAQSVNFPVHHAPTLTVGEGNRLG